MTTAHLRSKINRYFNQCRDEGTPPTPAGLALALDMRTAELTQAPMDDESRRLIDRALQRIEVGTLELLLNKSAARGLEIILHERLIRLARRIAALSGKTSDEKEELA